MFQDTVNQYPGIFRKNKNEGKKMNFKYALLKAMVAFLILTGVNEKTWSLEANPEEMVLVITYGQSLSVGSSIDSRTLSSSAEYPNNVLTLDSGGPKKISVGWLDNKVIPSQIVSFTPLVQLSRTNESPSSGAINAMVARYIKDNKTPPVFIGISGGFGGRSLVELMLRPQDLYASVEAGLAQTKEGYPFYTNKWGVYQYYLKINGQAVSAPVTVTGTKAMYKEPFYYNNVMEQVVRLAELAREKNLKINPHVLFIWSQGTADVINPYYKSLLEKLIRRMKLGVENRLGLTSMQMTTFISQTRGDATRSRAIDQMELARYTDDITIAAQELWPDVAYPDTNIDNVHLSKTGYRLLGEQIGNFMYDRLENGLVEAPVIRSSRATGTKVTVDFQNVRGQLAENTSIFTYRNLVTPNHFGFEFYNQNGTSNNVPTITASRIVGRTRIELDISGPITNPIYLYLGRNSTLLSASPDSAHAGTTLVDTHSDTFIGTRFTGPLFFGPEIPRYLPIQRILMQP